jgi:outer membrane protein assembly factor BamD
VRLSIVRALCLAGGLCGLVSACASSTTKTKKLSYGQTAKANYDKGMEELEDESYPEAVRYFSFVKSRFPFSQYATLAELRMADALFEQEKYAAAVDAYKLFISFHPTHPKVVSGYVGYRVCEAQLKQIPEDWFLIPPSHEKDQTTTRQAMSDLLSFMRSHPEGKYFKKVQKLYRQCLRRLVAHELYVARFYLERDKPKATIMRLEGILRRYPDAGVDPEVMLLLGQTYMKLDEMAKAQQTFTALVSKYPDDVNSAKAKLYLRHLRQQ